MKKPNLSKQRGSRTQLSRISHTSPRTFTKPPDEVEVEAGSVAREAGQAGGLRGQRLTLGRGPAPLGLLQLSGGVRDGLQGIVVDPARHQVEGRERVEPLRLRRALLVCPELPVGAPHAAQRRRVLEEEEVDGA
eukprot:scaffold135645_cov133-Phaeocystis_antarctica.AAC.2